MSEQQNPFYQKQDDYQKLPDSNYNESATEESLLLDEKHPEKPKTFFQKYYKVFIAVGVVLLILIIIAAFVVPAAIKGLNFYFIFYSILFYFLIFFLSV